VPTFAKRTDVLKKCSASNKLKYRCKLQTKNRNRRQIWKNQRVQRTKSSFYFKKTKIEKKGSDFLFYFFGPNPQISDYFLLATLTKKIENQRSYLGFFKRYLSFFI